LQEQAAYLPEDNPLTLEKIALGKQLFWDKRWSQNGTVACVSCHDPNHGWADPRQFSSRFDGKPTPRHSPTLSLGLSETKKEGNMSIRPRMRVVSGALLLAFLLLFSGNPVMALQVGDKAPDFSLPATTAEKISLADFVGKKPVVVFFYVYAFTNP
jgi:hypothetical protein